MLDKIFNSKIRVQILALFFDQPDKKYYAQEIINQLKSDSANTTRELKKMADFGILSVSDVGNKKYFVLNKDHELYAGFDLLFKADKSGKGNKVFFLYEDIPGGFPLTVASGIRLKLANDFFKKISFKNRFSQTINYFDNTLCRPWIIKSEFNALANEVLDKILHEPDFADNYNKTVLDTSRKAWQEIEKDNNAEASVSLSCLIKPGSFCNF